MNDIPVFSVDLLEKLDELYPERSPSLDMTEKEIWFYAGQRALVRNLVSRMEQQINDSSHYLGDDVLKG